MSVHYKFKAAVGYDTVQFDGLHISVGDLKKSIILQKRLGKATDFDLQITNAQTKEVYTDESTLIPKNTSVLVARIPLANPQQKKVWEVSEPSAVIPKLIDLPEEPDFEPKIVQSVDLASLDASEEDKIKAMMTQSTLDYDPSKYLKIRGSNQFGPVPSNYRCYKCHQPGHWIKNCPLNQVEYKVEIKKSTGIPRSFMVPVEDPRAPGALMTSTGHFAVPKIDLEAYKEGKKERPPFTEEMQESQAKQEVPQELVCTLCHDLLHDAVMIPCCGNSYCDECIRSSLLESEDHECPDCHEKKVSPDTLIPNRFLRTTVTSFRNETGYVRRQSNTQPNKGKVGDDSMGGGDESCDGVPVCDDSTKLSSQPDSELNMNENSCSSLINQSDDASKDFDYNIDDLHQRAATPTVDEEPTDSYSFYPDTSIPPPAKPVANITPILHDFSQPPPSYKSPSSFSPVRNSPKYRSSSYKQDGPRGRHHVDGRYSGDGRHHMDGRRYMEGRRRHHQNGGPHSRKVHHEKSAPVHQDYDHPSKSLVTVPVNEPAPPGVDIAPIPDVHRPPPPIAPQHHNYRNGSRSRHRGRGYGGQGVGRLEMTGTIDDPLEAFQRIMRERDERERKMRAGAQYRDRRSKSGSQEFKRSSSRSWSRSRSGSPSKFKERRSWSKNRSASRSKSPKSPNRFHSSPRRYPIERQGNLKKGKSYRNFNSPEKDEYSNQGRGFDKKDYYQDEVYNYDESYRFTPDSRRGYDAHVYYNEYKNYRNSDVETYVEKQPLDSDRRYFARCYDNSGFVGNYAKDYYDDYGKEYSDREYQYYRRKDHYNEEKSQFNYQYGDGGKGAYYNGDNTKTVNYGDRVNIDDDRGSRDRSRRTREKHISRNKRERSRTPEHHDRDKDRGKDREKEKEKVSEREKEKERKTKKSKSENKSVASKESDKSNVEASQKVSPEAVDKRNKTKSKDKKRKKKRRISEDVDSDVEKIKKKKKKDKKDKKEDNKESEAEKDVEEGSKIEPEVPCNNTDNQEVDDKEEEVSRVVMSENSSMKVFSSFPTKFLPGGMQKTNTITIKLKDRDSQPDKEELLAMKTENNLTDGEKIAFEEETRDNFDLDTKRNVARHSESSDDEYRDLSPPPRRDVKMTNSGIMVALPEKSKWELDEETNQGPDTYSCDTTMPKDTHGSLSNEILKRAEKAIFEKPLKALRPNESRKTDRKSEDENETHTKLPDKPYTEEEKRERQASRLSREEQGENERRRIDRSKFSSKADNSSNLDKTSGRSDRNDKSKDGKGSASTKFKSSTKEGKKRRSRSKDHYQEKETKDKSHEIAEKSGKSKTEGKHDKSTERDKKKEKHKNRAEGRKLARSSDDTHRQHDKREKCLGDSSLDKKKVSIDESSFEPNYDVSSSSDGDNKPEPPQEIKKKSARAKKRTRSPSSDSDSSDSTSSSDTSSTSCDKSDSRDEKKSKRRKRHDSRSDASGNSVKTKSKSKQKKKVKKRKEEKRKLKKKKKDKKRR